MEKGRNMDQKERRLDMLDKDKKELKNENSERETIERKAGTRNRKK
jgi:hypothetical protein